MATPEKKPAATRGKKGDKGDRGRQGLRGRVGPESDAYIQKADELQASIDGVKDELVVQNAATEEANRIAAEANANAEKANKRVRSTRVIATVATVAALLSGVAVWQLYDLRKGDCQKGNVARASIKDAFNTYTDALGAAAAAAPDPRPDLPEAIAAFKADITKRLAKGLPQRECG